MIDPRQLSFFSTLKNLLRDSLKQVAAEARIVHFDKNDVLFSEGDADRDTYFLLEGTVGLKDAARMNSMVIEGGTDAARRPLSRMKPRKHTCVAMTAAKLIKIDDDLLDKLLTADQTTAYEVTEFEGDDPEWMFRLLQQPNFQRIPTQNLAALFAKLETIPVKAGESIIRQGDPGDYYYLIRDGRAQISRSGTRGQSIGLAEIGPGQSFGEEALLSGDPRNASVAMLTDGILKRLNKNDFQHILEKPLVRQVKADRLSSLMRDGAAILDVRLEDEYKAGNLRNSINVPLYLLRLKMASLEPRRQHVLVCQTGRRSTAAAFLLSQQGFNVLVLEGGLNALPSGLDNLA